MGFDDEILAGITCSTIFCINHAPLLSHMIETNHSS